jgi:hypothetical protein
MEDLTPPVQLSALPLPSDPAVNLATLLNDRYTDQGDGTVVDATTGLMWKRCSEGQTWNNKTCLGQATTMTWDQAMPNGWQKRWPAFAGHADWRMPTKDELLTLVYCSSGMPKTWNDTVDFVGDYESQPLIKRLFPIRQVRLSGRVLLTPTIRTAWYVYFGMVAPTTTIRTVYSHVRLVRGGQ